MLSILLANEGLYFFIITYKVTSVYIRWVYMYCTVLFSYSCPVFFPPSYHLCLDWCLIEQCMKHEKLYQYKIILTWLLQFLKLCSPKPFRGMTTDTIGKFSWAECSRSFILSYRNAKLWPFSVLCFIRLITLFLVSAKTINSIWDNHDHTSQYITSTWSTPCISTQFVLLWVWLINSLRPTSLTWSSV